MKLVVIFAIFVLVFFAIRQKWRALPNSTKQAWSALLGMVDMYREMKKNTDRQTTQSIKSFVVPCDTCGLHIPESEGLHVSGQFYCCVEHVK